MQDKDLLHRLIDVFRFKENFHLQSSQLLPQDLYVLEKLYHSDTIKVVEFAQRYHLALSTLTGILDRLSTRKLIKRQRSKIDRKAIEIFMTAWGTRVIEIYLQEDKIFCDKFLDALSAEKQEQFKDILTELLTNLELKDLFKDEQETD